MARRGGAAVFVGVLWGVSALGCFGGGGFFGDDDDDKKGGTTEQAPAKPLCEGFTLGGRDTFEPFEQVVLDVRLRDDLAQITPPIAVSVKYDGSEEVLWASVAALGPEGEERYVMVVPPSARLWAPSTAKITLEVLWDDGEAIKTCAGEGAVTIKGLKEAPGTLAALVPRSRRLLEIQAQRMGLTLEDLAQPDPTTLPEVAQPLVVARFLLDGPSNPNSLEKLAAGTARDQADMAKGLVLAEALLAASKHVEELEETTRYYESLPPAQPLPLKDAQPLIFRPGDLAGLDGVCTAAKQLDLYKTDGLSYYMKMAETSRKWARDIQDPYDFGGAGYAVISNVGQVPLLGEVLGELPFVSKALTITATAIAADMHYKQFIADVYPNKLFGPSVEVTRDSFEEDSPEVAVWYKYQVSAKNRGGDLGKMIDSLVSGASELVVSTIPGSKLIERFDSAIGGKKIVVQVVDKLGNIADIDSKLAFVTRQKSIKDQVTDKMKARLGKEANNSILKELLEAKKACKIPERAWGPFDLSPQMWSTSEYVRPLTKTEMEDSAAVVAAAPSGLNNGDAQVQAFKLKANAGGGQGLITMRPMKGDFPPADNVFSGSLTKVIDVSPITVELQPNIKRVAPGSEEIIVIKVEHALDRSVKVVVYAGDASCEPAAPATDAEGNPRIKCRFGDDPDQDFPVRIAAYSQAKGGAVREDLPAVGYGTYIAGPQLELEPASSCVKKGASKQLIATVEGVEDKTVIWSASGGEVTTAGVFSSDKTGVYRVTATLKARPSVTASATVTVGECKCPWSAQINGPLPYFAAGYSDITAIYLDEMSLLQITAADKSGLRFVVMSQLPWGAIGTFGAQGSATPPGSDGYVGSFGAPVILKNGDVTESRLTILAWDGHKLRGVYRGSSVFIATQFGDAPLSAEISLEFDMVVTSATDIFGTITNNCVPD